MSAARLAIDKTITLDINGSSQRVRMCAERNGLTPMLIVQAGPGLPLLHEVAKFRRRLQLETDFLVTYWDQRGCGNASQRDAKSVSMRQQVDDLCTVVRWLHKEAKQEIIVFGISLGATIALQAAECEPDCVKSIVAISPDADTAASDAAVYEFLQQQGVLAKNQRLTAKLSKLGKPPYTDSAAFQLRAGMLADAGAIEVGKKFSSVLREALFGMLGTYGPAGTFKALRNMGVIQGELLLPLVSLDLFSSPPRVPVPVHYVFGEKDPLIPAVIARRLPAAITGPKYTVTFAPDAGHMVHFDQPRIVRAVAMRAANDA
jgi:pimeloyl-ACP methyl ester carboxylesterase